MTGAATLTLDERKASLMARFASNADGVIESLAREYGLSTFAVLEALPTKHRTIVPGERFAEVMKDLEDWGEVLLIVHTSDIVLECAGSIPPGTFGRGYYNMHGVSPIGGHIRAENCTRIAFVARPFMDRPSCSIQFFNAAGEAIFKVFVRRNEMRELKPEQMARFDALRARLCLPE